MITLNCALLTMLAAGVEQAAPRYDLLVRNGMVIDGTGAEARAADVLITDGQIVRIGDFDAPPGSIRHTLDATGMVVTPGFIDPHMHGDPLETPAFENFLAMGVTTICLGQDGESPPELAKWMRTVGQSPLGPNIAMFVGHGTVRNVAGVGLQRDPSPAQVAAMQKLVGEGMALGCLGMTTGLEYQPGSFANVDELVALAKPVAAAGGLVMSHLRSEDDDQIATALDELLAQGRGASCAVQVSHIKVTYGHGAERAERVLARLQAARDAGQRVTADIYPYLASYTGIGIVFPDWAKPPYDYAEVVRTRRTELAEYLRRRVTLRNGPEATLFGTAPWAGKTLAQVAAEIGKPFEEVLIDDVGVNGAQAAYFVMDDALQERLLVDPHVMICSDGSVTSHHPRGHGAFARVIRKYVVERKSLRLEAAVRKMTGFTAEATGLARLKRGRLAEGWAADVLVFDPQRVRDNATYEQPHRLASGFDYVIVNGEIVRERDQPTERRAGRLLRRPDDVLVREIEQRFQAFARDDAPGVSVAVIRDGHVMLARSFGLAQLLSPTAADSHTSYRIASMTKQFTAMCIMMLKDRGKLSYDDPVTQFFPEFPEIGRKITVRHLLGHTSGLIDYEELLPADQTEQLKDRDVLTLVNGQHGTYFTPGTQYRYSNTGYALLALIVERASGLDFASFLRDNLFHPLEMQDTVAYESGGSEPPRRAFGFRQTEAGFVDADQSLTSAVLGDGGIYTSLIDYARWDAALYDGGLVSPATLAEAFESGRLTDGTTTGYGFGWRIDERRGRRVVHHDGGTCGFNSAVRRVPAERMTLVVLMNRAGRDARQIADELLDWLLQRCAG